MWSSIAGGGFAAIRSAINCRSRVSRASASNQRICKVELSIGFMGGRSPPETPPILTGEAARRPDALTRAQQSISRPIV